MAHRILIVEDELTFSTLLKTWLEKKGFSVDTASNSARARKLINTVPYELVLSDYRLPDQDGLSLLSWMNEHKYQCPFIMMTHYADIQTAVQAIKLGAVDYLPKPVQPDELLSKIQDAIYRPSVSTTSPNPATSTNSKQTDKPTYVEGKSDAARQLYNYADLVAPTAMSVLICGASGTGKEYIAHRIHEHSKRAEKPFIALDCGSIPKDLAASEFFGHIKGSFTGALSDKTGAFEEADGGTLFLDEVGNLSYDVQVQLLRALQERRIRRLGSSEEKTVDIRLVCATNEDLPSAISNGTFREDLYHRINEFTLTMPDLGSCDEDIMLYANFFLDQSNKELDKQIVGFDAAVTHFFLTYSWPGNLRQLKNRVKRATLLAKGDFITIADIDTDNLKEVVASETSTVSTGLFDQSSEKERIISALQSTNNNKSKAAQLLQIDRKTLYNKMKLYNIR